MYASPTAPNDPPTTSTSPTRRLLLLVARRVLGELGGVRQEIAALHVRLEDLRNTQTLRGSAMTQVHV
jgi:hypothetical protein